MENTHHSQKKETNKVISSYHIQLYTIVAAGEKTLNGIRTWRTATPFIFSTALKQTTHLFRIHGARESYKTNKKYYLYYVAFNLDYVIKNLIKAAFVTF